MFRLARITNVSEKLSNVYGDAFAHASSRVSSQPAEKQVTDTETEGDS